MTNLALLVISISYFEACKPSADKSIEAFWDKSNLNTVVFANGDSIPIIMDSAQWAVADYPACCMYNNVVLNADTFGLLYNWYAIRDPRGLCPKGWHVATAKDWETLVAEYGGDSIAAKQLKGRYLWLPSDFPGNDNSGLNFIPGGNRRADGGFNGKGSSAPFWTANEIDSVNALARFMNTKHYRVGAKYGSKRNALACRCVQDNK